jgi:plasminogen activator inhibitor 1 RNA-binding protein
LNDAVAESNNEWGPPAAVNTGEWDAPAGTGDWGSAAPTSNDQWAAPVSTDAPDAPAPEKAAGDRDARKNRDREPEEEDNTLTLTQYLAKKKESEGVPKLDGPRRANEGVDDNIWKDVVPLKKDEEANSYFVGKVLSFSPPHLHLF